MWQRRLTFAGVWTLAISLISACQDDESGAAGDAGATGDTGAAGDTGATGDTSAPVDTDASDAPVDGDGQQQRPFEVVASFDPSMLPEGLAVSGLNDRVGLAYVGIATTGEILEIDENGESTVFATVDAPPPGEGFVTGITFSIADQGLWVAVANFAEGGESGVYEVSGREGGPGFLLWTHDDFVLPNAMAVDDSDEIFLTDSGAGAIFKLHISGDVNPWLEHDLLAGSADPECGSTGFPFPIGANGIVYEDPHLPNRAGRSVVVANTDQGTLVRIPIEEDQSAGTPEIVAGPDCMLFTVDGIASDGAGAWYAVVQASNSVVHVTEEGAISVISSGPPLDGPASIVAATVGENLRLLVTSSAFGSAAVEGGNPMPALVRLDL